MQDDAPSTDGRFTKGNRFWEARSSAGPKPIFATPEALWAACIEYFAWNADNPLYESKPFAYEGKVTIKNVPKMRAMSIGALCIFLDIGRATWNMWRAERPDLLGVILQVDSIIFAQKFEGASADLLNPNIIARDLGLADRRDLSSSDGTMTPQVTTFTLPDNGRDDRNPG